MQGNMVAGDTTKLSGLGFIWEHVLRGGGIKGFLSFVGTVGVLCVFFALVTGSVLPFGLFAVVVLLTFGFMCYLASSPEGRLFFLDSSSYVRVIKMQMDLMSDKSGPKQIGSRTQFVQPTTIENSQSTKANIGDGK